MKTNSQTLIILKIQILNEKQRKKIIKLLIQCHDALMENHMN